MPVHLTIIPDGNRRWSRENRLKTTAGYVISGSFENIRKLFNCAKDLGVKYCSIWGFSTENWDRDKSEIDEILRVVERGIDKFLEKAHREQISFKHIGRKDRLPEKLIEKLELLEKETIDYVDFVALLCLDYGGRDEMARAVQKAISAGKKFDEESFMKFLDTAGIPEPELIIRTGGEKRLSGFMPYQTTYSEIYFTDKFFPDFSSEDLKEAVKWFGKRERRFGG